VMTPKTLDTHILESSNVIALGSIQRQELSQLLSTQANQIIGVGIQSVLPTFEAGLVWSAVSPWNTQQYIVVATGVTEEGALRASNALERTTLLTDRPVKGVIVRPDGALVPFWGFDQIALPASISDVTVANATVPTHLSK
jgi:hypothetical protein